MTGSVLAVRLPHRIASGASQMAVDAALLGWAAAGRARLIFRTYGWARPTLSLGRGEPFPGGWDPARLAADGVDVARRPTGGDAVLHDDEITFAAAASLPGPWALTPRAFADTVADAVAGAVSDAGVPAERAVAPGATASDGGPYELACFARVARGEVRSGEFKIAGLASRFARGAALCHASLPIGTRYRDVARYRLAGDRDRERIAGHARSIGELLHGTRPDPGAIADAIAAALANRLGVRLAPATFDAVGLEVP